MSLIGRQLGDFLLDKKLGAGGMGEVYRARQISLDRIVAVKVLPRSLATQEGFEERFRREARAAANLIHPNVIQVYHIGIDPDAGTPYFAMEYVEGDDLQQRLKRLGRLPFEQSIEIVCGVTAALASAFEKGIVHRDIKPSNIMIDRNEIVKVMDFGLAKATQDPHWHNLTQSGLIMGTPNYISPEAGKGDPIDNRSDIYSLGVVLYELLTGTLPFSANTPAAIIYKHVYEPPPPMREVAPDVPPFLEEICLRMMAKEPKDRYPNAKALLSDLNEFKRHSEHYMKGGARRTPAIGSGSFSGESTLAASGEFPGRPGPGSRSTDATAAFQSSATAPDGTMIRTGSSGQIALATPPTPIATPLKPRLPAAAVAGIAGLAVFALAFIFVGPRIFGPSNGTGPSGPTTTVPPPATKAILAVSKLEAVLPKRTDVLVLMGFDEKNVGFTDRDVDAGEYTLIFRRRGFNDVSRKFRIAAEGIEPPFEAVTVEFKESDETRRELAAAEAALAEKRYQTASEKARSLLSLIPDYEPATKVAAEASKHLSGLETEFTRGHSFYQDKRYQDTIDTLKKLPTSYEKYDLAQSTIRNAEAALELLKQRRKDYDRALRDGLYPEARDYVNEVEKLLPATENEPKELRDKIQEASRLFEDGRREVENRRFREGLEFLDKLLAISPNHREGGGLRSTARSQVDAAKSVEDKVAGALKAGNEAFAAGRFEAALAEARAALAVDRDNVLAKDLADRATLEIIKGEIVGRFAALDGDFRTLGVGTADGSKRATLLEMIDRSAHPALKPDLDHFDDSPIEVHKAEHTDFDVRLQPGGETVLVECTWNVTLGFPLVEGANPPAVGRKTSVSVRQKVGLKRAGQIWFFTSFEQVGPANVKPL